jgi:hypothetical protein
MNPFEHKEQDETVEQKFVNAVYSQFQTLQNEITERNEKIKRNDQYIYGDLIHSRLDIPVGHDFTPVNWLRRTVEIHRSQFMGKGFAIDSSYKAIDITTAGDDKQELDRIKLENEKKKSYAETRRELIEAIIRDNGGYAFWSNAAENASAVGDTVIKAWYDKEQGKYILQQVESIDNFYALWSKDDYREVDAVAYVYQISKSKAKELYDVDDDVVTSPLGDPLTPITSNNYQEYISSQTMVTIMEVTGKIEGWKTNGNGKLVTCKKGQETDINVVIVGNCVEQVLDDKKTIPKYYILPNKRVRRRPWGSPDITESAIQINLTYIEALSDWRTVASKVNFPKFKAYGFPIGVQMPKPKQRTVEMLPLAEGQDIIPLTMGQSAGLAESDFTRQLNEMENQFVREVGISRQLFDMPDSSGNSNPAILTSMKSISDITNAKRELWEPIIRQIFEDALNVLALHDSNIKEVTSDEDWFIKVSFPSAMNADDPSYHSMKLNQFNTGLLSVQSFMEDIGYDKQEIDRIRGEMEDPLTAAIHGHSLQQLAMSKIAPQGPPEPKVSINLRGDMTPEQEANLAYQKGFNEGPFGSTQGPQGNAGMTAQANEDNAGFIEGAQPRGGTAITRDAQGNEVPPLGPTNKGPQQTQSPELINGSADNRPGVGIMSQPGTGAPMTTPQGKMAQMQQRQGL